MRDQARESMREGEVILKSVDTRKRKVAEKGGLQGGRLISHAVM